MFNLHASNELKGEYVDMGILQDLEFRGLINQQTDAEGP